ncbi:hypothetical protein EI77_01479 [Prosthecobacter fusiformis]|uniref:Uncharacterized protein n=1 Tax=Prosthecobacter fusiformis TaxID=48464 RepID=A0A4V3FG24_9BACT|nr:hypothetical protein [Prosthecobacter fusiformis]TDU73013.1 hypothetical protein EI77_01479 [Prosthecobacter fusiformis]
MKTSYMTLKCVCLLAVAFSGALRPISAQTLPKPATPASEVQPPKEPLAEAEKLEWKDIYIVDVKDMQLDAMAGVLIFSVSGTEYLYQPKQGENSNAATNVSACADVVERLKHCGSFKIRVAKKTEGSGRKDPVWISELRIPLDLR